MKKPKAKISEPHVNENKSDKLEECKFNLEVKDETTSLAVEGTLWGISEAIANVAVQREEVMEIFKMVAYMLFMHEQEHMSEEEKQAMPVNFGPVGKA